MGLAGSDSLRRMGRTQLAAAVALTVLAATAPASTAAAVEPAANDAAAEATHDQLGTALKAQTSVTISMTTGTSEFPELSAVDGVFDIQRRRFLGTVDVTFFKATVYSTPGRTLIRLQGTSCWKRDKDGTAPDPTGILASPKDLIDKETTGPAVFSAQPPDQITWTLGGTVPATVTERYDPATLLPMSQDVAIAFPKTKKSKADVLTVKTDFTFTGQQLKAPKTLKLCKTKRKKSRR